jgi:hypothetical protein
MDVFDPNPAVARIREQLGHPVIDSDGHLLEVRPPGLYPSVKAARLEPLETLRLG